MPWSRQRSVGSKAALAPPDLATASALLRGPYDGAAADEAFARAELDVILRKAGVPQAGLDYLARAARAKRLPGDG